MHVAPAGRFRQVAVALTTDAGKLTAYVAFDPAFTVTAALAMVGAVAAAEAESTSNCMTFEVALPDPEVCTLIPAVP